MFVTEDEARVFVESLEALPNGDPRHPAKIMMHQAQRLISLADDLPRIRPGNETLPLLFLLICAEHIAKLFKDFTGDGQSRSYVRNFFEWFLTHDQKEQLSVGVRKRDHRPLSLQDAVDTLYDVRCDVVHEGKYQSFHFGGDDPMLLPDVIVSLTLAQLRHLIVMGCIAAIQRYPGGPES